ncbi:MAG: T9SS type A sorting domain-containing protein [Bacteroidota bacterium]|jgi:hypothetical protein|nr:T9SS type A sorting domain-containing protein [Bacteroidota bacterium]
MKPIHLLLLAMLVVPFSVFHAQEYRGAELDLRVGNGNDRQVYLFLGVREGCTSGLDLAYEEYELPPTPPNEIFDARVIGTPGKSQLGTGSYRDYRAIASTTAPFTETYTIAWQCGEGSNGILVALPDPMPARIAQIRIDGEDMTGETSWTSTFLQGQATVEVRFNYVALSYTANPPSLTFAVNNKDPLPYQDIAIGCEGITGAAWSIQYDAPWLYVSPSHGNGAGNVRVSVISSSQPAGSYQTVLQVRSPVYDAQLDIPVSMSMTVGVHDAPAPNSPALYRNYPNPFHGQTQLRFRLGDAATTPATLRIYDNLGREIADLSALIQDIPVPQSVVFDAAPFPAGMYTCRLTVGPRVYTVGMLLMK